MAKGRGEGDRIPADWSPDEALIAWGLAKFPGLTRADVLDIADGFLDHWLSEAGAKAYKCDWDAAFRNWMRRGGTWALEKKGGGFVF